MAVVIHSGEGGSAKCTCCNAVIRYEVGELKENFLETYGRLSGIYVSCPVCGNMIPIGRKENEVPSYGQSTI